MITNRKELLVVQGNIAELELAILDIREDDLIPPSSDHVRKLVTRCREQLICEREAVDVFLGLEPSSTNSLGSVVRRLAERVYNLEERTSETMSKVNVLSDLITTLTADEAAMKLREQGLVQTLKDSVAKLQAEIDNITTNDTDPTVLARIQAVIDDMNTIAVASDGGGGGSTVVGGSGDDSTVGGSGGDSTVGGDGTDTTVASTGTDSVASATGTDSVASATGTDSVDASTGT